MIDLHMHSKFSDDGEFTPSQLVEQCAFAGIRIMSITDHNCARANAEAREAAEQKQILYISGIEADCTYQNTNFHVLGYGIDLKSGDFERLEDDIKSQCARASRERLSLTRNLGFHVTEDELRALSEGSYWEDSWTGEMFAEILLQKPEYSGHPLLMPYRPGGERSNNPYVNFYWDYYAQGKPCYAKMEYPSMEDIIDLIHHNRGMAVLAHPGANLKEENLSLLDSLLALKLDGVEAYSSYHTPRQAEYFRGRARESLLFVTCGSDYHGKTKPSIRLGQHNYAFRKNGVL